MKFVHPNILYFLFLLVIPIIIHLFNFRRYKKLYFSSLQFVQKIEKETNATKTLRQYLILACRLLAFTFLIFAFAQPYFPSDNQSDSFKQTIPIYLDNSFSMSAKGSNGDLLNQAKETVRRIVASNPRDQRYIMITNSLSGNEFHLLNSTALIDRLQNIQLSPITRNLITPIESLKEYFKQKGDYQPHHYIIISDFQKRNLLKEKLKLDTNSSYSFFKIEPQIKNNLYIDSVWFEKPYQKVNQNNTLNIKIQNTGKEKLTNVEIDLILNSKRRQTLTDIAPNNSTIVKLNYINKTSGIKAGEIKVQDANLPFDNHYYFSYEVKNAVNVSIINGENSVPFPRLVYATDSFYKIQTTNIEQLQNNSLESANLIVLNELDKLSSGLQTQIEQLVKNGTSLLIIPAKNFDKTTYNQLLNALKLPLLNQSVKQDIRIGKIAANQSFFQGMFSKKVDNIRMPPLKGYLSSDVYNTANFKKLISYENGMPFLVQQGNSDKVYMLYSPINPVFNDFGKSGLFSTLLLRIGENSIGTQKLALKIGTSDQYKLKLHNNNDNAIVLKNDKVEFIPEMQKNNDYFEFSVRRAIDNEAINDGIYSILLGGKNIGKIALNYNRQESDMQYASKSEITSFFKKYHLKNITTNTIATVNDIQTLPIRKSNELWRILLTLSLVFFLIEMSIIIFWKAR